MPRSFDLSRKPKARPAPLAPAAPVSSPSPRRRKNKGGMVFLVFAVGAVALGLSFNQMSKHPDVKPAHTSKQNTKSNSITSSVKSPDKKDDTNVTTTTKPNTSTTTNTTTTPADNKLKIQILNGTGIETVTDQVKNLLVTNNLPVESTSKAQFEYSQTYIYYRPQAVESAKKISGILSAYKPTLSESQISGLFDILVIVGKQNLPPAQ